MFVLKDELMSNLVSPNSFSPLRSFFWPVYAHELRKVVPMLLMLFLICFNYNTLRNLKDTLVVTAHASGAEVIPFIKVWVLLPSAVLMTIIFTKLSNYFSQEKVFYYIVTGFLLFFVLFTFVLYPLRDYLHPHEAADSLAAVLPPGFKGFVAMIRNWTFTLFYVMSELWGTIAPTVLFWGFANAVTTVPEARRFYSVFTVGANISAIAAGQSGVYFSTRDYNEMLPFGNSGWEQSMTALVLIVIFSGIGIMLLFRWLNNNVLNTPNFEEIHHTTPKPVKPKEKLSFRESFTYLSQSKYLICIAVLVVAYNLVINLVEVVWKDQLRNLCTTSSEYNRYLNNVTTMVGVFAMCLSLSMTKLLSRFGWTRTALITPLILLLTSISFFTFMFFKDNLSDIVLVLTGTTPLAIAVFIGATQNCLSKAAKYSVFDGTKEMAFIPLSHECKLKGKAAIDGVGSRFGKSGGSFIHQGLLMIFTTLSASAPYVAGILMLVIVFWISATRALGKQFNSLVASQQQAAEETKQYPEPQTSEATPQPA
jgi:AAA family ATP:ADP antiporter